MADSGYSPRFLKRLALTCSSAMAAEAVTYPIDVVKTRLQLQGELQASGHSRKGALGLAKHMIQKEGLKALYAGLTPAVVRHIFYTGTRITVYEQLRTAAAQSAPAHPGSVGLLAKLGMGLTAGAIGQAVAVPADLIKVRMQADGRLVASGKQAAPRYKGMADAFMKITHQNGIMGLWRGAGPAIQRAALVNLGELATYDQAKQGVLSTGLIDDNVYAHGLSSVCSGFFASVVSVPADVVKTRMMSQDAARPVYRGSLDCLVKSVRAEGIMAMYKGFFPTWARLGPWQLVFWTTYEQQRKVLGLGGF